jgi:hypothetical protein
MDAGCDCDASAAAPPLRAEGGADSHVDVQPMTERAVECECASLRQALEGRSRECEALRDVLADRDAQLLELQRSLAQAKSVAAAALSPSPSAAPGPVLLPSAGAPHVQGSLEQRGGGVVVFPGSSTQPERDDMRLLERGSPRGCFHTGTVFAAFCCRQ